MLINDLKNAGLDKSEAKVYLAALELGETNISRLAKKSGIKRTTTYLVVESLGEKGLMVSVKKKNKTFFYAEDPRKIDDIMMEKKKAIDKIMPELLAFTNLIDKKPKIKYFEGKDAYKEVFRDVLKYPSGEMLGSFNEKFWDFDNFFTDYFIPKRKEKKIWARILLPNKKGVEEIVKNAPDHFFQGKIVPSEKYNIDIEMVIYAKNKIGLVSYDEEISIIIESQKIFNSLKSMFEVIWESISAVK
jgi:HTH-type transcriptional regulator, sugar sensing transcriptional regulator